MDLDGAAVLAATVAAAPMAFVLVAGERALGVNTGGRRDWCDIDIDSGAALIAAVVGAGGDVVEVPDVHLDPRLSANTWIRRTPSARLFAGAALTDSTGRVIGSVGVLDSVPRCLTPNQLTGLSLLVERLGRELEQARRAKELEAQLAAGERSNQELRDRVRLLDGMLAHADVLVYAKDLNERFLYANPALEQSIDVAGGVVGRANFELFPTEWAEEYRINDALIAAGGRREVFDEEIVDSEGSVRQLRSTKYPLRDEQGEVYAIAGVSTDVTELVATRVAHAEAEQRWRSLVEHSAVAVGLVGAEGRIRYLNPAGVRLCGADTADQIEGRPVDEFVPADARPAAAALLRAVFAGETPRHTGRWRLRRLDGAEVIVELNAAPVNHLGERAVQLEVRDVSARAAAEDALRKSERRFRAVFEDSPVAMALSDENGRWVDVNPEFCEMYGRSASEMVGSTAADYAYEDDVAAIAGSEHGQRTSVDGVHRFEARFHRPDGELRRSWISVTAIPGPAGEQWTLAVVEDITSRRAAEEALRASEAELGAIAEVARCVQSGADPRPVVVRLIRELAGAATVSMVETLDAETLVVTTSEGSDLAGELIPLRDRSVSGEVWSTGRAVFIGDVANSQAVHPMVTKLPGTVSALWQPVIDSGKVEAVLLVTWTHPIPGPEDSGARAVRILADEAATSLAATRLRGELERFAMTDPLTGSLNRRAWDASLSDDAGAVRGTGAQIVVALVDLDRFKAFNDTFGHSEGDALLRDFAAAARACLRKDDVFARWGGEEFSIALADVDSDLARQILDRVRMCVPRGQTCSIGYTVWDPDEPLSSCITRADAALYDAKDGGRNRLGVR